MRPNRLGRLALATAAVIAFLPAWTAQGYAAPPDGSCSGKFVTPSKPSSGDWKNGQDLKLWNCTNKVWVADVVCHPYPTFEPDNVCWTRRVEPGTYEVVSVPWNRQVHAVNWY